MRTWCNGSTIVSKTISLGSNPRVLATMEDWPSGLRRRTTNALAHTRPWVQILHLPQYGELVHLEERIPCKDEVSGPSPLFSTRGAIKLYN